MARRCGSCRKRDVPPSWSRAGRKLCTACWCARAEDRHADTDEDIERLVEERLPTMPSGGHGEAPPYMPGKRESAAVAREQRTERTWREWDVPPAESLHPDTSPEAIAATHRALVEKAAAKLGRGATAEQISELAVLPVWNVKRHLESISKGA
jgi:hypothetical protein